MLAKVNLWVKRNIRWVGGVVGGGSRVVDGGSGVVGWWR